MRARLLARHAAARSFSGPAGRAAHRRDRRRALHRRERRRRSGVPEPAAQPRLRAAVRLGMAARAIRATGVDEIRRGPPLVGDARAAHGSLRRALRRIPAEGNLSAARRHALQHRVRAVARARFRSADRACGARGADRRHRAALASARRELSGVGAERRRIPVAGVDGGGADAARVAGGRVSRVVRRVPAVARRARAGDALHARHRHRPHRRQDRAPRRPEPEPRVVPARARAGAAGRRSAPGGARRRGRRASGERARTCRGRLHGRALARVVRAACAGGLNRVGPGEPPRPGVVRGARREARGARREARGARREARGASNTATRQHGNTAARWHLDTTAHEHAMRIG
ncbi:hypothetical protein DP59_5887 [Burkholderia pseudomallei]|nr:hypothetical protein DP59_5887 [Burkholderia pseudomallei]